MLKVKGKTKEYPVLCAWCLEEGVRTVINRTSVANSHGICPRHAAEMVEQSRRIARALCRDIEKGARTVSRPSSARTVSRKGAKAQSQGQAGERAEAVKRGNGEGAEAVNRRNGEAVNGVEAQSAL